MVEEARDPSPGGDPEDGEPSRISGDLGFDALAFSALEHATDCLGSRGADSPLLPFAMIVDGGERSVRNFAGPGYEQTLDGALAFASEGGYEFWAVAWDGYVTLEGRRTDAVFVRAGGAERDGTLLFAWPYERVVPKGDVRRLGDPLFLGRGE